MNNQFPQQEKDRPCALQKAIVWFWIATVLILVVWIPSLYFIANPPNQPRISDYVAFSKQEYSSNGELCVGYRIIAPPNTDIDDLISFSRDVCSMLDGYYLHTLWFYESPEQASGRYTVAMIEQNSDHTLSVYQKGSLIASVPDAPSAASKITISILLFLWAVLVVFFSSSAYARFRRLIPSRNPPQPDQVPPHPSSGGTPRGF